MTALQSAKHYKKCLAASQRVVERIKKDQKEILPLLGSKARLVRLERKFGLRQLAGKMSISPGFLVHLEKGERSWNPSLFKKWLKAIQP
jgi:hypothetical protein